jgi:hypothetical protein
MIVLAVLSSGPAHGYAVIEEIKRRSGGAFDLPEGTVYRCCIVSSRRACWPHVGCRRFRETAAGLFHDQNGACASSASGGRSGSSFPMPWAVCSRKAGHGRAGVISEFVERLARELEFDASLSRCVRQEVEDPSLGAVVRRSHGR